MRHMGWSWQDLQGAPAWIVYGVKMDMQAQAKVSKMKQEEMERAIRQRQQHGV